MKAVLKFPTEVHAGFLQAVPLMSRDYELLKNSVLRESANGQPVIEILCDDFDAKRLLLRAKDFYYEAMPFIEEALRLLSI